MTLREREREREEREREIKRILLWERGRGILEKRGVGAVKTKITFH